MAKAGFDDVDIERLRRRRTVKWALYGPEVLAAWVAEMDFDVAPAVRTALIDAVDREDFGYVVPDLSEMTTACADFFAARYGWTVSPARIFSGRRRADRDLGRARRLRRSGCPVVVPTPAYPPFFEVVGADRPSTSGYADESRRRPGRARPRRHRLGARGGCAGGAAVQSAQPDRSWVHRRRSSRALAEVVERHGARVIADEVHAPLVFDGLRHVPYATVSDATAEHSVTVTSASKAFNIAGLKCAQIVATNHADATRLARAAGLRGRRGRLRSGSPRPSAAYRDGGPWLDELVEYLAGNRATLLELLAAELPGISCRVPEATFLAWLDCSGTRSRRSGAVLPRSGERRAERRATVRPRL